MRNIFEFALRSYSWCRTYFLQRGRSLPVISDPDALVSGSPRSAMESPRTDSSFGHLEAVYVKLYLALRYAVKSAFVEHTDVLDAGRAVQVMCLSVNFARVTYVANTD